MEKVTIAFVCVQNAGRSQMSAAFARREKERRKLDIEILTGGTDPADSIHPEVVKVMKERSIDLSNEEPQSITTSELEKCDYVITMGCSASEVCPANMNGENRDWELRDPHNKDEETVRSIRDEIQRRITVLFDELEGK